MPRCGRSRRLSGPRLRKPGAGNADRDRARTTACGIARLCRRVGWVSAAARGRAVCCHAAWSRRRRVVRMSHRGWRGVLQAFGLSEIDTRRGRARARSAWRRRSRRERPRIRDALDGRVGAAAGALGSLQTAHWGRLDRPRRPRARRRRLDLRSQCRARSVPAFLIGRVRSCRKPAAARYDGANHP